MEHQSPICKSPPEPSRIHPGPIQGFRPTLTDPPVRARCRTSWCPAEAICCGVIVALGEQVADRYPSIKLFSFARHENAQKLAHQCEPLVDSMIRHSGIVL